MITLTSVATQRVKDLVAQRGTPGLALRIGVRGGGCSGNSYFMEFCEAPEAGDQVIECDGVRVIVDARSAQMLGGTEVDYVSGLMGAGFKFSNPNVRHNCACGESFSA
ncbi:MAG: iron-sulfur cluster assembly accessory protein [Candidatus Eisenbacteria bacterium]|nr:iron-sulfur cluster assembly accessory protein [Candidatus Eisenbacteria bacterium]